MRSIFFGFLAVVGSLAPSHAQRPSTEWINVNAITIEDASATMPHVQFEAKAPAKFRDARIFGFGEATTSRERIF